jgi:hypothetical protein
MAALVIASYTYPIWGLVLLFLLAKRLAPSGPWPRRIAQSGLVAAGCALLFAPVAWGTQGFAFIAPWPLVFFDPKHVSFAWPFALGPAIIAFSVSVLNGKSSPRAR